MSPRRFVTGSLLSLVFSATAVAQMPAAPPTSAPAPGARTAPLPRERGPLVLGQDAFTVMHACQKAGWGFYARAAEDVKLRRGTRFALTTANVLPPDTDEARRYRLTFLDGKLIGLRVELRAPDPARVGKARATHGTPFWEMRETAEWVAADRSIAYAVWTDGTREELVFLGQLRARGFYTADEIAAELKRRFLAAKGSPVAPTAAPAK